MLRQLHLENFKGFAEPTSIPLAPITLLFGENSAGKSSIVQALKLIKQTIECDPHDAVLLVRTRNGFCDLGSFPDVLHNHDRTKTLRIGVTFDSGYEFSPTSPLSNELHRLLGFSMDVGLSEQGEITAREITLSAGSSIDAIEPYLRIRNRKCTWFSRSPQFWKKQFDTAQKRKAIAVREMKNALLK